MNSEVLNRFLENYGLIILFILELQNWPILSEIMRYVKKFISNGYNEQASVKMTLNKNHHLLEKGWNEDDTDSEKEDTDSEEEEDSQESDDEKSSWTVICTIFFNIVFTNKDFCSK